MAEQDPKVQEPKVDADRRAFLVGAGKAAVVVPPAMTFLLSTTLVAEAVAVSNNVQRELGSRERNGTTQERGSFNYGR